MSSVSGRPMNYRVGLMGKFDPDGDYRKILPKLHRKCLQAKNYCDKYRVPITFFLSEDVPEEIKKVLMRTYNIRFVQRESLGGQSKTIHGVDPDTWIKDNCDLIYYFTEDSHDYPDFGEAAFIIFVYRLVKQPDVRRDPDPNYTVRKAVKKPAPQKDGYRGFNLIERWERVPNNHMQEQLINRPEFPDDKQMPYSR